MALTQATVTDGLQAELAQFEALVRSLDATQWAAPSRCAGWTVADVAAHVVGTMVDVVNGRFEGLGTPEVTEREVLERRDHSPAEVADELGQAVKATADLLGAFDAAAWEMPAPGGFDFSLGEGVEALWYDAYLHADDIRAALGHPSARGGGLGAAVSHVASVLARQGWGPATLALDGLPEIPVGTGGRRVTGDPLAFVLATTGRADPAPLGLDGSANIYR